VWVLLEFIGLLVLFAACVHVLVRIVRRQDLGVGGKAVWIVAFIMFPPGALLAYLIWADIRRRRGSSPPSLTEDWTAAGPSAVSQRDAERTES